MNEEIQISRHGFGKSVRYIFRQTYRSFAGVRAQFDFTVWKTFIFDDEQNLTTKRG